MKLLVSILTLFLIAKDCDCRKLAIVNSEKTETLIAGASSLKLVQDEKMTLIYTAQTRGTYQNVSISKSAVSISNSRNENERKTVACSYSDWKEIMDLVSKLNIESLPELKAPSVESHRDAALAATLTLKQDGREISTPRFDHGNPPKEIKALVNKVLSIRQSIEKQ